MNVYSLTLTHAFPMPGDIATIVVVAENEQAARDFVANGLSNRAFLDPNFCLVESLAEVPDRRIVSVTTVQPVFFGGAK
jgi:hypothetical protein